MDSFFAHALRNPQAAQQAAKTERRATKQDKKGNSSNVADVACSSVHTGAGIAPSYAGTEAENDTITSTLSTRGRKKKGHVLLVITNRTIARITPSGRRRIGCPLKERSSLVVLETLGACSSHTSDVEISEDLIPANIEDKHRER
jgi:hypothetical protein